MEFEYQAPEWNKEVKTISMDALVHAPSGQADDQYQFTDLYNEGLAGILTEQTNLRKQRIKCFMTGVGRPR